MRLHGPREMSLGSDEDGAFLELAKLDAQEIRTSEGKVEPV